MARLVCADPKMVSDAGVEPSSGVYAHYVKRALDFLLSLVALILFWWVLAIIAILVRIKLGSPVIFKQVRPGRDERCFELYKFRSMTDERDEDGNLLTDDARLTSFGKKLRSTSLDELPELFNILKGDMALVGPRPQLVRDMVFMAPKQRLRHLVRPGLTGLAQVNGRNAIDWDTKLDYDISYIQGVSFLGDLRILTKTAGKVFSGEGVAAEGMETSQDYGDYLLARGRITTEEYSKLQVLAREILRRSR